MIRLSDQERYFLRRIEEGAGKRVALWVLHLKGKYEDAFDELQDRDRGTLIYRQLQKEKQAHLETRTDLMRALGKVRRLLDETPVPEDKIRRVVEKAIKTRQEALAAELPAPVELPR